MRTATALRDAGLGTGEVVAVMLRNEPVLLELMLAARWIGARWCPINWHFKAAEVRHILVDSEAKLLVVHADLLAQIEGAIPESVRVFVVEPRARSPGSAFGLADAVAAARAAGRRLGKASATPRAAPRPRRRRPGSAMVYTSGTTGLAKGIRREPATPEQLALLAERSRVALGVEPGMRALVSAPLYHSAPAAYAVQAALNDAHLLLEPRFDAERTLQLIESERLTHPTWCRRCTCACFACRDDVRRRYDLSSVRFVASSGSPCAAEVKRAMIDWWGPVFHEAYAASELGWISHIDSHEALQRARLGRPGDGRRAAQGACRATGQEVRAGHGGAAVRARSGVPDFTYATTTPPGASSSATASWTLGDMGYLDRRRLPLRRRPQNDMVIAGGVNIYPAEIEAVLITMPGVADCAVFGIPDAEFGEVVAAAVQPAASAALDAAQVRAFLRERLADFKVPRVVAFHDELPREDTGKIFKRRLREPYWAGRERRI